VCGAVGDVTVEHGDERVRVDYRAGDVHGIILLRLFLILSRPVARLRHFQNTKMRSKTRTRAWWLKARIGRENDGRVKISTDDKEYIKKLYHVEKMAVRAIARTFPNISRRAIQFILFPERLAIVKARAIEVKRWEAHNGKEERKKLMREFRAKIRKIYKD
jgi:hypothetical protein